MCFQHRPDLLFETVAMVTMAHHEYHHSEKGKRWWRNDDDEMRTKCLLHATPGCKCKFSAPGSNLPYPAPPPPTHPPVYNARGRVPQSPQDNSRLVSMTTRPTFFVARLPVASRNSFLPSILPSIHPSIHRAVVTGHSVQNLWSYTVMVSHAAYSSQARICFFISEPSELFHMTWNGWWR